MFDDQRISQRWVVARPTQRRVHSRLNSEQSCIANALGV
jgi:hypothetical protein